MATINIVRRCARKSKCLSVRYRSTVALSENRVTVQYPRIKPKYPSGKYGWLSSSSAWALDGRSTELLTIQTAKERLESISGQENQILWLVDPMDSRPNNIDFRQRITKTHIVNSLPSLFTNAGYQRVISPVVEAVELELSRYFEATHGNVVDCIDSEKEAHRVIGRVIRSFILQLAATENHLLRSQFDEDVRVEAFWCVGGFTGEGNVCDGKLSNLKLVNGDDAGILIFQYRNRANWQVRYEFPLQEFLSMESELCIKGFVPSPDYPPDSVGMTNISNRPIATSGHWIGDPCEFTGLSVYVMPLTDYKVFEELGAKYALEALLSFGLTSAFGSCVAQAYNQGFTHLTDITYPITTQCIVTDGQQLRIICYQLNTLCLWIDDGCSSTFNQLRNIAWVSEPMPLFDRGSGKLSTETLQHIANCLFLKPVARVGVDMRPYLPKDDWSAPQHLYINHMGEEFLPFTKIGRFQYPKNPVYF